MNYYDNEGAITQADIEHLVTDSRSLSSATMVNYRRTLVDAFPAHIQRTPMDQARIARISDRGRERSGDRGRERSGDRGKERDGDLGIGSYRECSWEARKERKWEGSGERGQGRNRSRERSRERHQRRADSHTER